MHNSAFCHIWVQWYHQNCISDNNIEWFLKDIPTSKMQLVREEVSRVTNCWRATKKPFEHTLVLPTCTEYLGETFLRKHSAEKSVNRQALLKILSKVRFLVRGDKAGEISSNFNQLCTIFLNDWLKQKCDKYTSKGIQNEMMKVMVLQVLREVAADFRSADFLL